MGGAMILGRTLREAFPRGHRELSLIIEAGKTGKRENENTRGRVKPSLTSFADAVQVAGEHSPIIPQNNLSTCAVGGNKQ
jgi:hypothetical protein